MEASIGPEREVIRMENPDYQTQAEKDPVDGTKPEREG